MLWLRPSTADDLPAFVDWEADPDTGRWLGDTGPAWHARATADPDQEHLTAVDEEVSVGFAVLARLHDSAASIELRRIVIAPAHRQAGHGRALLGLLLDRAYRDHGARSVWLDVKSHNHRARALYESAGFTVTKTLAATARLADGTGTDLVIMTHQPADR